MKMSKTQVSIKLLIFFIIMVFILWISTGLLTYFILNSWEARGTIGDMFGSINSLFSGLAFAGLIYTILLQRSELRLQQEELSLQRTELRNTTAELKGQKELINLQRFESTFFHLVSLHNEIISGIEIGYGNESNKGRGSFYLLYYQMRQAYWSGTNMLGQDYKVIFKENLDSFGNYARNFFEIIKYIDESLFLNNSERERYINFITAQLSTYEYIYLYYYLEIMPANKIEILKDLIEKYNIFNGLENHLLLHNDLEINATV